MVESGLATHVFAAAEQQGGPVGICIALDVPNEDDVIAAVMPALVARLEMGGAEPPVLMSLF
jgi:hypothetical protein